MNVYNLIYCILTKAIKKKSKKGKPSCDPYTLTASFDKECSTAVTWEMFDETTHQSIVHQKEASNSTVPCTIL